MVDKPQRRRKQRWTIRGWLRQRRGWLTINGFHYGDVRAKGPVLITAQGAVNGTIIAPKVIVAGRVGGDVAAMDLIVEKTGAIWGNVAASQLALAPNGKLHGWLVTIDQDGFLLLQSGDTTVSSLPPTAVALTREDVEMVTGELTPQLTASQLAHYRRLQAESAAAIMAKAALDLKFEAEVNAVAGEKLAEATALREELTVLQSDLVRIQSQLGDSQAQLSETSQQLETNDKELLETRESLAVQMTHVGALEEKHQAATAWRACGAGIVLHP